MDPNFYDLRYFLEIAQTQNLSRAAERLGITQPTLTQSCRRLEDAVGTQLLIRSKKGVELTVAGQRLRGLIQILSENWEHIRKVARATTDEVTGVLRLGCHVSVALYSVPYFLPQILKKHKSIEVQIEHDLSRKIVDRVIHFQLDMGIVVNPTPHPDLVIIKLATDIVTLWEKREPEPTTENVLIFDPSLLQAQDILTKMKKLKNSSLVYNRKIETSSLELATQLTAAGGGHGIIPTRVVEKHAQNKLKTVKGAPTFQDEICLVYRQENKSIKMIEAFASQIKKIFQD